LIELQSSFISQRDGNNNQLFYDIPYNFVVSQNGDVFEGRGWNLQSELINQNMFLDCLLIGTVNGNQILSLIQDGKVLDAIEENVAFEMIDSSFLVPTSTTYKLSADIDSSTQTQAAAL